jgi:hypothetical protein
MGTASSTWARQWRYMMRHGGTSEPGSNHRVRPSQDERALTVIREGSFVDVDYGHLAYSSRQSEFPLPLYARMEYL